MTSPDNTPEPPETPLTEQEQAYLDRFSSLFETCNTRVQALVKQTAGLKDQAGPEELIRCAVHIEDLERFVASLPNSTESPVHIIHQFMFRLELAEESIKAALAPKTGLVVDAIKAARSRETAPSSVPWEPEKHIGPFQFLDTTPPNQQSNN